MYLRCGCNVSNDGTQIIKMCPDHYRIMSGGQTVQEPPKPRKKLFGIFRTDIFENPETTEYFKKNKMYQLYKGRIF